MRHPRGLILLRRGRTDEDVDAVVSALDEQDVSAGTLRTKDLGRFLDRPHRMTIDFEDQIAALKTGFRGGTSWLDAADDHALGVLDTQSLGKLRRQVLHRQTELGFGLGRFIGCTRAGWRTGVIGWKLSRFGTDGKELAIAPDFQRDRIPNPVGQHLALHIAAVADGLAIDLGDDVAATDSGLFSRSTGV